ncbi:hypothetical protein COU18_02610 [Candidatus Kaiserbacteria bacterium CG10_big_fil_rev_8_21_14_0_10_51_14]|uniref:PIN domain-containing protein n=1 Tax=Candidatus Kaiserbacteria bacterium CG10_big_fil_rev_8_21_14_0_10_51_14 TaxID=1974610 RepID=A0A2H0UAX9_9BACT|nr:MAG: hypothetical protein COU18_02610 [Candidatus Kaiserbacteria bacterium CG10_big_fil_rev_8_21_14_0_10_51_14]
MATIADTSVLVAALSDDDALHSRGVGALRDAGKPIYVPEYVVIETVTVLAVRLAMKDSADDFIHALFHNRDLRLIPSSPAFFIAVTRYFLLTKKRLSFVDCALATLAREHTVLTFDKALAKAIREEK